MNLFVFLFLDLLVKFYIYQRFFCISQWNLLYFSVIFLDFLWFFWLCKIIPKWLHPSSIPYVLMHQITQRHNRLSTEYELITQPLCCQTQLWSGPMRALVTWDVQTQSLSYECSHWSRYFIYFMTAMFVSYNSKSYHSAGRLRDQLAISRNLVDNRLCLCPKSAPNYVPQKCPKLSQKCHKLPQKFGDKCTMPVPVIAKYLIIAIPCFALPTSSRLIITPIFRKKSQKCYKLPQ